MSKVEVSVTVPVLGRISAEVDREELAKNLKIVGRMAKERNLRPGETRGVFDSLKYNLGGSTRLIAGADKIATLHTILKAKGLKEKEVES